MDTRVERTRRSLQEALLELARADSLDSITIGDITAHAGLNRSSFYQHYADKDTLLADALESAADDANAEIPYVEPPLRSPPAGMVAYFEHIEQNVSVYRRVLGENGSALVAARLRTRIGSLVRAGLGSFADTSGDESPSGLPVDILSAAVTGATLGIIEAWVAMDPLPAAEVPVEWVWRILRGPDWPWN